MKAIILGVVGALAVGGFAVAQSSGSSTGASSGTSSSASGMSGPSRTGADAAGVRGPMTGPTIGSNPATTTPKTPDAGGYGADASANTNTGPASTASKSRSEGHQPGAWTGDSSSTMGQSPSRPTGTDPTRPAPAHAPDIAPP